MVSAVSGKQGVVKPSIIQRANVFLREVWVELQKAHWPSKQDLIKSTGVVISTVVAVAVILAVLDQVFAKLSIALHVFPK